MPESLHLRRSAAKAGALLLAGLVLAGFAAREQQRLNDLQLREELDGLVRRSADQLVERVRRYEDGLRGARGAILAAGAEQVTREQFLAYHGSRDIDTEFPGARGFGFIRKVPLGSEDRFSLAARLDGQPYFAIHDLNAHGGDHYVIQYIEPVARNAEAVGLDIASEVQRREAAEQASRSGQARITGPITLVQATGQPQHAFLILLPIYRPGRLTDTPSDREAATFGWAYVPLVIDEVLAGFSPPGGEFTLQLFDVSAPAQPLRFYGHAAAQPLGSEALAGTPLVRQVHRRVFGRDWLIELRAQPPFVARMHLLRPGVVFGVGALTALLLAALLYAHLVNRSRLRLIRAHRARMTTLVENSSDAIIAESLDGRLTAWNRAAERIFGHSAAEALGRHAQALLLPPDRQSADQLRRERVIQGEPADPVDAVMLRRNGSEIEVSMTVAPINAPDGRVVGIGRTIRDIGAHKTVERQLQEFNAALERQVEARTSELATAHRDLQTLLDAVPSMIGYWDQQLINRFANHAYGLWFGTDPAHMAGRRMPEVMGAARFEPDRGHVEAVLCGEPQTFERSLTLPDGHSRHALAHYLPDRVDGEVQGFYVLIHDVTELTEGRQRLADSEAFLERAGRLAAVGGWRLELASRALTWTKETFLIHGLPTGAAQPTLAQSIAFHPEAARETLEAALQRAIEQGGGWDLELPLTTADGRAIWVRTIGEAEHDGPPEAPPTRLVGAIQDITARREADAALDAKRAAEAASAAKSAFLATMSHEMRTPLNALIGLSHLLEGTPLDAEQRDFLTKIQLAGRSLLGVINAVLDLAKIEAGEMPLEQQPFELRALLDEVAALLGPQADAKQLALGVHLSPALPAWVLGDAGRLRQILVNLIGNAIKFTERGRVDLSAEPASDRQGRALLRLAVRDTGIGIGAEDQARLFQPFVQADASTTRRFGGTGLGLSIVRHLAQMMGGDTGVNSQPGAGSEFWVTLPLDGAAPNRAAGAGNGAPLEAGAHAAPQSLRVLIGQGDARPLEALAQLARQLGWQVESAAPGRSAVQRWQTTEAAAAAGNGGGGEESGPAGDVLLIDWPSDCGRTGPVAIARLCEPGEARRRPALVACSAAPELLGEALAAGVVDAVLALPADAAALFNAVSQAVATREGSAARVLQATRLAAAAGHWLDGLRVMVVDDSATNREVAERLLRREGAEVITCPGGEEALARLREAPDACDLLLMDVQMPQLDGHQATRRIRRELGLTELPIVALTAGVLTEERQRALAAGMNDFVGKPIDPRALLLCLRQQIERVRRAPLPLPQPLPSSAGTGAAASAGGGPVGTAAANEAASADLPQIDGIDSLDMVSRIGHDRRLFASLLARVLREFAGLGEAVPEAAAERASLVAQLHKLRGSSGMLGARELARLAGNAEQALRQGQPLASVEPQLQAVGAALRSLQAASAGFLAQHADDAEGDTPGADAPPSAAPSDAELTELAQLLRQQDLAALDRFQALAPGLRAAWGAERFRRARQAIDDLQFRSALAVLEEAPAD
jgi:PAS domain S-box-containing protein